GQVLAQVDRPLGGLAGVGLGGHLTGQAGVQAGGQGAGLDGVAEAGDELVGGALGAEVDVGQDLQLHRLTVPAGAEVLDPLHVGYLRQAGGQPSDGGHVRGGDCAAAGDDDGDRCLVQALERGGQPGG